MQLPGLLFLYITVSATGRFNTHASHCRRVNMTYIHFIYLKKIEDLIKLSANSDQSGKKIIKSIQIMRTWEGVIREWSLTTEANTNEIDCQLNNMSGFLHVCYNYYTSAVSLICFWRFLSQNWKRDRCFCLLCGWNDYKWTKVLTYIRAEIERVYIANNFLDMVRVKLYISHCVARGTNVNAVRNLCVNCDAYAAHTLSEIRVPTISAVNALELLVLFLYLL